MQCNDRPFRGSNGPDDAAVRAIFELGTNNSSTYTPSLTDLFVNGATETALTAFDAATLDGFFDTTAYVGAVADANDTWYAGWTCNSATASFGDTSGNCTDIPVRSEEHTSELQSLMRISYAVFCLKKKNKLL